MTENAETQELIQVGYEGELPSQIADLSSLISDFKFSQECVTAYLNLSKAKLSEESHQIVAKSLWTSAAIAYRRGFTTGKAQLVPQGSRLKIPDEWLESLKPEFKEAHEEILEIANRQVAHHTGKLDHFRVTAFLAPPPHPRAVVGTGVLHASFVGPLEDRLRQLATLCQSLIDMLQARLDELNAVFKDQVAADDLDALYAAASTGSPGA